MSERRFRAISSVRKVRPGFKGSEWRVCRVSIPQIFPSPEELEAESIRELSRPVNILLGSKNATRDCKEIYPHIFTCQTPNGSFMQGADGIVVGSPEFCFYLMARKVSLIELIELGYELCGTYSLPAKTLLGERVPEFYPEQKPEAKAVVGCSRRVPLTSLKRLEGFAVRMSGVQGYRKVARALRYVIEGAASPMETKLAMLLTLPWKLGGYGLSAPEMNKRVELTRKTGGGANKSHRSCDLFWQEHDLAVEYDSDQYHTGAARIAKDSKRRNALTFQGITVITVTKQQLQSAAEFDKVARQIAAITGKRLQFKYPEFSEARNRLRSILLKF